MVILTLHLTFVNATQLNFTINNKKIGDLLAKQGKEAEAMEQYSLALSCNPKDEASLAG